MPTYKLQFDVHIFNSKKDFYNNALENSGHKQNIELQHYVFAKVQKSINNRGRKIIFFNPPFGCNVTTNIRKKVFLIARQKFY